LRSPNFLLITAATLLELLKMNLLNVDSELEIVAAVLRWIYHREPGKLEPMRAQTLLGPCLQHIRFLALPATDFSMHVTKSGLLRNDECLALLVNLASPGEMPIPNGICTVRSPRQKPSHAMMAEKTPELKKPQEIKGKSPIKSEKNMQEKDKSPVKKPTPELMKSPMKKPSKEIVLRRAQNNSKIHKLITPLDHLIPFKVDKPVWLTGLIFNTRTNNTDKQNLKTYSESIHICVNREKNKVAYQSFHGIVPYGPNESFQVNFKTPGKLLPNMWHELKLIYPSEGYYRNPWMQNVLKSNGVTWTFAGNGEGEDDDGEESPSGIVGVVIKL
jgi:BTB And C-terminal Kelch